MNLILLSGSLRTQFHQTKDHFLFHCPFYPPKIPFERTHLESTTVFKLLYLNHSRFKRPIMRMFINTSDLHEDFYESKFEIHPYCSRIIAEVG